MDPKFDDIRPYNDAETLQALRRLSLKPVIFSISKRLFPNRPFFFLSRWLRKINSIEELQSELMASILDDILANTSDGLSINGLEYLEEARSNVLFISNHRDIVLDPAFLQLALIRNGHQATELCVGSNLIDNPTVCDMMRSNRMIIVKRGIQGRERVAEARHLSEYIRQSIKAHGHSVWIAQKQGRAKDGIDTTSHGVLKMLLMSGQEDLSLSLSELNLVPMTISYEYEPCDYMKAREVLISRTSIYKKGKNEDLMSILEGMQQRKGGICLTFGKPLGIEDFKSLSGEKASLNEFASEASALLDRRIRANYHIFDTNLQAKAWLEGRQVSQEFRDYIESRLDKAEALQLGKGAALDRGALREILLGIYANPVIYKNSL